VKGVDPAAPLSHSPQHESRRHDQASALWLWVGCGPSGSGCCLFAATRASLATAPRNHHLWGTCGDLRYGLHRRCEKLLPSRRGARSPRALAAAARLSCRRRGAFCWMSSSLGDISSHSHPCVEGGALMRDEHAAVGTAAEWHVAASSRAQHLACAHHRSCTGAAERRHRARTSQRTWRAFSAWLCGIAGLPRRQNGAKGAAGPC
jgi:hypothetical protein